MNIKKYTIIFILLILSFSLISCCSNIKEAIFRNDLVSESKSTIEYDTDGEYAISKYIFTVDKGDMNIEFRGKISTGDGTAKISVVSDNEQIMYEQSFCSVENQKINIKCENLIADSKYRLVLDGTETKKLKVILESYNEINFISEDNYEKNN